MKKRKKINLNMAVKDILLAMGEGTPGGIRVLADILNKEPEVGLLYILDLDDMNIRGSQIWVGYKDHCGENLDRFIECIEARDGEMVRTINRVCEEYHGETAVTSGASFDEKGGYKV